MKLFSCHGGEVVLEFSSARWIKIAPFFINPRDSQVNIRIDFLANKMFNQKPLQLWHKLMKTSYCSSVKQRTAVEIIPLCCEWALSCYFAMNDFVDRADCSESLSLYFQSAHPRYQMLNVYLLWGQSRNCTISPSPWVCKIKREEKTAALNKTLTTSINNGDKTTSIRVH